MKFAVTIKENVTTRLPLLDQNVRNGVVNGMTTVLGKSTLAMQDRVKKAVTETGARRAAGLPPLYSTRPAWYQGRGPGRIESSRMYNSIGWRLTQAGHGADGTAGFINTPPVYLAAQELGTQRSGRRGRGIEGMLAFARGKAVAAAILDPTMQGELGRAVRAASNGRTWKRKL